MKFTTQLLIKIMLWSKLHCQKGFKLKQRYRARARCTATASASSGSKKDPYHRRPFVGVSQVRSWSHWFVFVGKYRQKLINLMEIDF